MSTAQQSSWHKVSSQQTFPVTIISSAVAHSYRWFIQKLSSGTNFSAKIILSLDGDHVSSTWKRPCQAFKTCSFLPSTATQFRGRALPRSQQCMSSFCPGQESSCCPCKYYRCYPGGSTAEHPARDRVRSPVQEDPPSRAAAKPGRHSC